ncbi:addiction module toxin RelE [Kluyvera intermedia]|uniref:Addiction module toxin RelE n=1 Tax=Kluyvera intermedia TaxID=61648 RepID=A0ABX3UA04_KLUIN|nr:addiction module toxin RelE [Kluyvera intermedia]
MKNIYTQSFKVHRGGKRENPHEQRKRCDWGEYAQPTKKQREG